MDRTRCRRVLLDDDFGFGGILAGKQQDKPLSENSRQGKAQTVVTCAEHVEVLGLSQ